MQPPGNEHTWQERYEGSNREKQREHVHLLIHIYTTQRCTIIAENTKNAKTIYHKRSLNWKYYTGKIPIQDPIHRLLHKNSVENATALVKLMFKPEEHHVLNIWGTEQQT